MNTQPTNGRNRAELYLQDNGMYITTGSGPAAYSICVMSTHLYQTQLDLEYTLLYITCVCQLLLQSHITGMASESIPRHMKIPCRTYFPFKPISMDDLAEDNVKTYWVIYNGPKVTIEWEDNIKKMPVSVYICAHSMLV